MRQTKKITLSAMIVAISVAFLTVGAMWEVLDLSLAAFASVFVAFVYIEIGSPYTWLVWLLTSLITAIIFPGSIVWAEYLGLFGIYPILKAYIERLPRIFWIILKLVYINAIAVAAIFLVEIVFSVPFFSGDVWWINTGLYLLVNVAFFAYDIFLSVLIRAYMTNFRHRFRKFLK